MSELATEQPFLAIEQIDLQKALARSIGVVEARGTIEVYQKICFVAKAGQLNIMAMNMDSWITVKVPEHSGNEVSFLVDAQKICGIVGRFEAGCQIKITSIPQEGRITLSAGSKRFNVPVLTTKHFPTIRQVNDEKTTFELSGQLFRGALDCVSSAMLNDNIRPYLEGVCLQVKNGDLRFIATDRLSLHAHTIKNFSSVFEEIIIPRKAILMIRQMINGLDMITISVSRAYVEFNGLDFEFCSKLVEGNYPEIDRIIPQDVDVRISANTKDLLGAAKDIKAAAPDLKSPVIVVSSQDNELIMNSLKKQSAGGECKSIVGENQAKLTFDESLNFKVDSFINLVSLISKTATNPHESNIDISFTNVVGPCIFACNDAKSSETKSVFLLMSMSQ